MGESGESKSDGRARVLVVDDEPAIRRLLVEILADDYETAEARDGAEALDMVESFDPQVVLLDLMMPGVDGIQFLVRLQARGREELPVVVVSAKRRPEDVRRAELAGAIAYVAKPFSTVELLDVVEDALERRGVGKV